MQISLMTGNCHYLVTAISEQQIRVNDQNYQQSLLLSPNRLEPWSISDLNQLQADEMERICHQYQPEVILLGTGLKQLFPPIQIIGAAAQCGLALEVMTTAAACRTYAVLVSEGRNVLAALILAPPKTVTEASNWPASS